MNRTLCGGGRPRAVQSVFGKLEAIGENWWYNFNVLVRGALSSFCATVLFIGGCPKRQTRPRLVYVPPAPSAATAAPPINSETMVIEEPPSPEPQPKPSQAAVPTQVPALKHAPPHRRPKADAPAEADQEPAEPPNVEVPAPALQQRETAEQQAALQRKIVDTQETTQKRIAQLDAANLASANRKTIEDAKGFLTQSKTALDGGDLQRALLLVDKAALLVSAVEQSR
ncbi:MAG: hypothetical protein DMG24_01175 [Acidobacteria bacterium]|nr:MAG: hypothetical protein DMG24_01175 [Acidobacteriota bacterium]